MHFGVLLAGRRTRVLVNILTDTISASPRWLIQKHRFEEAKESLFWIRAATDENPLVKAELSQIYEKAEEHRTQSMTSWTTLFTDPDLFRRLWRVALLQFMSQMSGATAMKYYLPTNFIALGLGTDLALLASGIESSLKVACTIFEAMVIDHLGRRLTLLIGSAVMAMALLVRSEDGNLEAR